MYTIFIYFLNILGSDDIGPKTYEHFLKAHQNLKFLGLMDLSDSRLDIFINPSHPLFNPDLVVSIIQILNYISNN